MSIKNNFFISKELWNLSSKSVKKKILFSFTLTLIKNSLEILNIVFASLFAYLLSGKNLSDFDKLLPIIEFLNISNLNNSIQIRFISSSFAISLILWAFLNILSLKFTSHCAASLTNSLIYRLLDGLYSTNNRFFKGIKKEKTITNLILDANNVSAIVVRPLLETINSLNLIFLVTIFWFFYAPKIAIFLFILTFGFYHIFSKFFTGSLRNKGKKLRSIGNKVTQTIITNFQMYKDYFINNLIDEKKGNLKELTYRYRFLEAEIAYMKGISSVIVQVVFLVFILIYIGFSFSNEGINPDKLAAVSGILYTIQRATPSLQKLLRANSSINTGYPSLQNIMDNINFYNKNKSSIYSNLLFEKKFILPVKSSKKWVEVKDLNLKNISNENINQNISFEIPSKGCLGIVGKSGSGKTTLLEIIAGLIWIPKENGQILINGKNLYDKESTLIKNWISSLTYLEQKPALISGSLIENITHLSKNEINYKILKKILNFEWMRDILEALNYDTKNELYISDLGSNLSGGQVQRIALARSIYMDKKLLILDEATSALDSKNEDLVLESIKDISKQKSIIIVSHKSKPLQICNSIVNL